TLRAELAAKEEAYLKFRSTAPILGKNRDGLDLRQERLNSIQSKRSALLLRRLEVESQLVAIQNALKEGHSRESVMVMLAESWTKAAGGEPGREKQPPFQDHLLPLLTEERKLVLAYGVNHPEVIAIRNKIEVARQHLVLPWAAWGSGMDDPRTKNPLSPL